MLCLKDYSIIIVLIATYILGAVATTHFGEETLLGLFASFFKLAWWALIFSPYFLRAVYSSPLHRTVLCIFAVMLTIIGYLATSYVNDFFKLVMSGAAVAILFAVVGSIFADRT